MRQRENDASRPVRSTLSSASSRPSSVVEQKRTAERLTTEDLAGMISDLQRQVAQMAEDMKTERAIVMGLLAQHGDPTHLTVYRAAEIRGCSVKTIRREIDRGVYTLEQIPRTKEFGIPIEQFYAKWTPVGAVRQAIARERSEGGATLKGRRSG